MPMPAPSSFSASRFRHWSARPTSFCWPPGLCDLPAIDKAIASAPTGQPQIFETLARSADERIFPIEVRLHTADYFGQPVLVASAVDIAERKECRAAPRNRA